MLRYDQSGPMLAKPLTEPQEQILRYVLDCEVVPTTREIMAHFGYRSSNAAASFLDTLEAKGWLRPRARGARRSLSLPERWPYALQLPAKWCPCCRGPLVEKRCLRCRVTICVEETASSS